MFQHAWQKIRRILCVLTLRDPANRPVESIDRPTDRQTDQPVGDRSRYVNVNVLSDYDGSSLLPSVCVCCFFHSVFFPLSASFCVSLRRVLYAPSRSLARVFDYACLVLRHRARAAFPSRLHRVGDRAEHVDNFFEMRRGTDARIALRLRFNSADARPRPAEIVDGNNGDVRES